LDKNLLMVDKKKKKKPKPPVTLRKDKAKVNDGESLYCFCQQPYKKGQLMVNCGNCHGKKKASTIQPE
jgi:hypothetical protein